MQGGKHVESGAVCWGSHVLIIHAHVRSEVKVQCAGTVPVTWRLFVCRRQCVSYKRTLEVY